MPGVVGVYTAADLNLEDFPPGGPPVPTPEAMRRPVLARDIVRFLGEPVAVVVAETRGQAVDASQLVDIDFEPLDAVIDMTKALDDDAPKLFADAENGNLAAAGPPGEDALEGAEVRTGARFINQRLAAVPMEPGAALAAPDPDTGGFILWTPSQGPHAIQGAVCAATGIEKEQAAGGLDRDRRRLRRADRDLPGADRARRAGAQARPPRALRGDALGDHARDAARPRAGAGRRDRRHPRRQGHRAEGPRDPGLRRLPGRRGPDADAHRPDVVRRLRVPEGRLPLRRGRDQYDPDRRLPRRRPAGGDRARRARDGPVRGRARDGSGRGPAAQLHQGLPAPDRHRRQLRLRRLPRRAREVPAERGLRPAARGPEGAPRPRRRRPARDRHLQLRRVDGLRLRARHVRDRGGRHGHGDGRHVLARPGP